MAEIPVPAAPAAVTRGARAITLLLNFRSAGTTLECLTKLLAVTGDDHRIVLMDNGSGSDDEAMLAAGVENSPRVEFLRFGANLGYCAAMNRGIALAAERGADYVLFFNNDVEVDVDAEAGFVDTMIEVLDNDPSLAGVGPTILRPDGRVWCQGAAIGFSPNINWLRGEGGEPAPRSKGPRAVGYLPGACALYRVADLRAVGGLDERYFMYFEDARLGDELRRRGRTLIWLPWLRVVHDASSSSGGGRSPLRKYMTAVNTVRFLKSHFAPKLWAAFFLFDCLGLPLAYRSGWRAGWAKTAGVWDGIRGHVLTAADVNRWLDS